ncbi:hypothetical protein B0H10DRAFT_1960468 [Mycena sp. CBHHK59/15]|nr:hypothetical protein B0H10DRAFT_1960468 [Mycena sp. CBHHK59/15]
MIKSLKDLHKDYVFSIFMSPRSAVKKGLPWVKDEDDSNGGGSPLDFDYNLHELTAAPNSVLSICQQIAGIDNTSNPQLNKLLEAYPINNLLFPGSTYTTTKPAPQPLESPPVVLPHDILLEEYFDQYHITPQDHRVLTELDYASGDNGIKELEKDIWEATRVFPLAKRRITEPELQKIYYLF